MEYFPDPQNNIKKDRWNLKGKHIQLGLAGFPGYYAKKVNDETLPVVSAGKRK